MVDLRRPLLAVCALCLYQVSAYRIKRQQPQSASEEYVDDYAGNENVDDYAGGNDNDATDNNVPTANDNSADDDSEETIADYAGEAEKKVDEFVEGLLNKNEPKEDPVNTFDDTFKDTDTDTFKDTDTDTFKDTDTETFKDTDTDTFKDTDINNDVNEDRFGGGRLDDDVHSSPKEEKTEGKSNESETSKHKKHVKKNKYLKKALKKVGEFLKKVLDPNKLMDNAYVTEMLRQFSNHETKEVDSLETQEVELTPPAVTSKKRRGRPRRGKIPPGIAGLLKRGMMALVQMELDKNKLRRNVRLIRRIARKAKKPLKTAVKIFLSSRNQGMGMGYGGGGYNNNY